MLGAGGGAGLHGNSSASTDAPVFPELNSLNSDRDKLWKMLWSPIFIFILYLIVCIFYMCIFHVHSAALQKHFPVWKVDSFLIIVVFLEEVVCWVWLCTLSAVVTLLSVCQLSVWLKKFIMRKDTNLIYLFVYFENI